jgi:hypothetical protein
MAGLHMWMCVKIKSNGGVYVVAICITWGYFVQFAQPIDYLIIRVI